MLFNSIGQSLVCIRLGLLRAAEQYSDTELAQNSLQLAEIIKDLRTLNNSLDPEDILKKGIMAALAAELDKIKKYTCIHTNLQQTGEPFELNREATYLVFRMLQECMHLAAEHTQPVHLLLSVLYTPDFVIFSLKDDGRFTDERPPLENRQFLHVLEERARSANAVLKAAYTPEYGSHVTIKLSKIT